MAVCSGAHRVPSIIELVVVEPTRMNGSDSALEVEASDGLDAGLTCGLFAAVVLLGSHL